MTAADPLGETQADYDANARAYAEQQWATRLQRQMTIFTSALPGRRVLDLGCGPGRDVEWLQELGYDVTGVDLSSGMLAEGRRRLPDARFVRGDIGSLPLATSSLDGIWSCSAFVHLDHRQGARALGEIARSLRAGGALYLGLEQGAGQEWRTIPGAGRRLFQYWQPEEIASAVEEVGLTVSGQYVEHVDRFAFLTTHATKA
jgi:ubiquinone/menaquinone biosynthesis C-methylase UbiE